MAARLDYPPRAWSPRRSAIVVTAGSPRLISVVLPVHNQASHIGAIVESYREVLGQLGHPYEVVLSVNGGRDDSADVCRTLAQANQQIVVISDPRAGWGLAVKAGLRAARGDLLADTNCARTAPRISGRCSSQDSNTLTRSSRPPGVVRDNWKRRWDRRSITPSAGAPRCEDPGCGCNPQGVLTIACSLARLTSDATCSTQSFLFVCRRNGFPVIEVPIFGNRRQGGSSTTNYRSAVGMYVGAYRLWRATRGRNA